MGLNPELVRLAWDHAVINNTQETQLCKYLQNCEERDEPWDLNMQRQKRLSEGDR